ncbi:Putative ubiquitin-conjugating enzyme E2, ubiquitin-conjugating enzyme/RWD [Septoria linicola]|uniref:Ubiquitin-conjugating enzyme E2, ubiquitin-conjugating enzyme/RWD n=1 Tax=Septoria linicola TaxID=215465 RepID=A0A9Q9AIE4_9PEZI|nr:putative ubiquitin-conjugating enzyme E2, ubiquitin-conjugating enzyme/RWD [Septoria linicola]USW47498.1 Putative ubiquitin-conjugating enzyme E2, ubiquitin-conjugating enzyme/RWD [Septoria linicola]
MNSKTLRRLAKDHATLHNDGLPTNYLFPPANAASALAADDLTQLNVLLAGPTHTPFAAGLWRLHLSLPDDYPQTPPTASFRTKIFHPNVNQHGQICVETLKRDWDSKLTLRDVLVTISCLLIQPNPDSALNAEAGALIQQDYASFAQRAELMTSIHAAIPASLSEAVREAQNRGNEAETDHAEDSMLRPEPPARRRRTIARVRGMRRNDGSPGDAPARRAQRPVATASVAASTSQPFVFQARNDDVFGTSTPLGRSTADRAESTQLEDDEDEEMTEADQENSGNSPDAQKASSASRTPRRPHGMPIPLGELILPEQDDGDTSVDDTDVEMEAEYPPSPRKSPTKSPTKIPDPNLDRRQSNRQAPMITPPNISTGPRAGQSSMHTPIMSARKVDRGRRVAFKLSRRLTPEPPDSSLLESFYRPTPPQRTKGKSHGALQPRSPGATRTQLQAAQQRALLEVKLWDAACGDIRRYNRGDFGDGVLERLAARW